MVWVLTKKFTFESAHRLPNHQGKCSRLHGHSWIGYVYVLGESLMNSGSEAGMVVDYGVIKSSLEPLVNEFLDHQFLNETTGLENPTSEEVARWIYEQIRPKLPGLVAVRVDETCTSQCLYTPFSDYASRICNEAALG